MSVWFAIPSCRVKPEAEACLSKWKSQGYKIAILRQGDPLDICDLQIPTGEYLGWPRSVNILAREVLRRDRECNFVVSGGDDYNPDPKFTASEIGFSCEAYFGRSKANYPLAQTAYEDGATLGVMQPVADRWGDSESARQTYGQDRGAVLDRVAGSPWMGREWCERAYLDNGPMWDGYHHLYADEELCCVAEKMGVYWRRPDLNQYHAHPARGERGFAAYHEGHLANLYSQEAWAREKAIFEDRKAKGFPGSELCPR